MFIKVQCNGNQVVKTSAPSNATDERGGSSILNLPSLARLREESGLSGSMENEFAIHIGLTSWLAQTHRRTMVAWSIHSGKG